MSDELKAFLAYRSTYPQALSDTALVEERDRLKREIAQVEAELDDVERGDDDDREERHEDLCGDLHSLKTDLGDVRAKIKARGITAGGAR